MPAEAQWMGQPSIKGSREPVRMALLTASLVGLQFTWGIEMTYCTPYLLSLGLSKSATSAVWIAGPLSGLVMQPLVGVVADRSRSRYGRRRPFMLGGTIIVVACLLFLGWTREIVGIFSKDAENSVATVVLAVGSIWVLDFAVNAVQASDRSLIVDTLPTAKQQTGSAWASRMTAVGHLVGYGVGTLRLREIWGDWLGDTQFKQLIWIAVLAMIISQSITSWAVKERVLISVSEEARGGAFKTVVRIFKTTWNLPNRIQAICWIQFWAWIGWFPFLFYSPTWVGETYFRYEASPEEIENESDILGEIGRIGSLSLVIFSVITFIGSVLIPLLVKKPEGEKEKGSSSDESQWKRLIAKIDSYRPDLRQVWFVTHCIFAAAMIWAPFVRGLKFATFLVSICGIPWALAAWAPFAFMGVEINRLTAPSTMTASGSRYQVVPGADVEEEEEEEEMDTVNFEPPDSPTMLRINHGRSVSMVLNDDPLNDDDDGIDGPSGAAAAAAGEDGTDGSTGETSGIYLGILNLYTTLPQFFGTFISMLVFAIFEPGKSKILHGAEGEEKFASGSPDEIQQEGGVNAIGICLFIGALCSLGAAYATRRLKYVH